MGLIFTRLLMAVRWCD